MHSAIIEYRATCGVEIARRNRIMQSKSVPLALYTLQMPRDLTWDRKLATAAVENK
jgi:hypothetical protein